ncbi:hypothetical protein GCM10010330_76930 [Streptomyces tendae]|nr:hypothetical protein GCM10010330_76930 [Streptomyces tendae]
MHSDARIPGVCGLVIRDTYNDLPTLADRPLGHLRGHPVHTRGKRATSGFSDRRGDAEPAITAPGTHGCGTSTERGVPLGVGAGLRISSGPAPSLLHGPLRQPPRFASQM